MNTPTEKRKPGRPATGRKKVKITASISIKMEEKIRKLSLKTDRSFSSIVEEMLLIASRQPAKPKA